MKSRIGIVVIVVLFASVASAAVPPQNAGFAAGNVRPNKPKASFLSANQTNGGADFILLKTSRGYRFLTLLAHEDDTAEAPATQLTMNLVLDMVLSEQGSEIISIDEDAIAELAAGTADIDPVAYLQSARAMKKLTSIALNALNNAETPSDAASSINSHVNSQPVLDELLQDRLGGAQKASATQTKNNAFSLVVPASTHEGVVVTLEKNTDGYHFQILVASDELGASPDTAMRITIVGQDVDTTFDEDVLDALSLETQSLDPVAGAIGAGETGVEIAPANGGAPPVPESKGVTQNCNFQTVSGKLKLICFRLNGNQLDIYSFAVTLDSKGGLVITPCGRFHITLGR